MRKKSLRIIILSVILLLLALGLAFYMLRGKAYTTPETMADKEKKSRLEYAEKMKDVFRKILTTPIVFYGKVVDETGKGIPGVKVPASINTFANSPAMFFSGIKTYETETDGEGKFVFNGAGRSILIGILKKEGYEFDRWGVKDKFNYAKNDNEKLDLYKPDKNNPVIFKMRKKKKADFVLIKGIEEDCFATIRNYEKFKIYCNIYYPELNPQSKFFCGYKEKPYNFTFDLEVSPIDKKDNVQTLTLIMTAADGIRFQAANKDAHEAPEKGYDQKEKSFVFKRKIAYEDSYYGPDNDRKLEKVLVQKLVEYQTGNGEYVSLENLRQNDGKGVPYKFFVKDEAHNVYSLLNVYLEPFTARLEQINVELTSVTNPYGRRVLEIDRSVQGKLSGEEIKKLERKLGVKTDEEISAEWRANFQREAEEASKKARARVREEQRIREEERKREVKRRIEEKIRKNKVQNTKNQE